MWIQVKSEIRVSARTPDFYPVARLVMLRAMGLRPKTRVILALLLEDATRASVPPRDEKTSLLILDGILQACDRVTRMGYEGLIFALEWMPTLVSGHFSVGRFSKLSPDQRTAHIDALRQSKWYLRRALFKALLAPVWISHYTRTDVQLALGYDSQSLTTEYQRAVRRD